jgi:hypothetical protein
VAQGGRGVWPRPAGGTPTDHGPTAARAGGRRCPNRGTPSTDAWALAGSGRGEARACGPAWKEKDVSRARRNNDLSDLFKQISN